MDGFSAKECATGAFSALLIGELLNNFPWVKDKLQTIPKPGFTKGIVRFFGEFDPNIHQAANIPSGMAYKVYQFVHGDVVQPDDVMAIFDIPASQAGLIAQQLEQNNSAKDILLKSDWWLELRTLASSADLRGSLIADLANDVNFANALKNAPAAERAGWVKAWEELFHNSIDDVIRINTTFLIAVSKQLTNYGNVVIFQFERVLPNIPSNKLDDFFSKLDNPKSIDHVRSLAGDFENIPGISVSNYVPNGLANFDIPPPATWADPYLHLTGNAATTFTDATAKTLSPGQKIYRVLDQTQNPAGGYWTYSLPTNKAQLYGGTAVRPEWNAATHYVEYIVPSNGLKVWDGPAAKQAILDNVNQAHLPGGATQIFIPDMIRQDGSFSNLQLIPLSL